MSNFAKLKIAEEKVLIFAKRYSSESKIVIELFEQFRIEPKAFEVINLDERQDAAEIENYLHFLCLTDTREVCYFTRNSHSLFLLYIIISYSY